MKQTTVITTAKNKIKCIISTVVFSTIGAAYATPDTIRAHPDYKNAKTMIEKQGKEDTISHIVSLQKDIMRKHGNQIDDYTEVIGISGNLFGIYQKMELKAEEMLTDVNKYRTNNHKKPITRERLAKEMSEGGILYANQVKMLCSTPGPRAAIDSGINYTMMFYDIDMVFIGGIKIDSFTCLKIGL